MKEKLKKYGKRILIIMIILMFDVLTLTSSCKLYPDVEIPLHRLGSCGELLTYKGETVETYYAYYATKSNGFPTYCLDITKQGVNDKIIYGITEKGYIKDEELWRYIVNGFPYKTKEELGCETIQEAYMATQQAIYCYLYGYNVEDFGAIGEAGKRTLNALKKIVYNAKVSTEKRPENTVIIEGLQEDFEVDPIDNNYISKTYKVTSESPMIEYIPYMDGEEDRIFKKTDENNVEKVKFQENEKFKILIPKEFANKKLNLKIYVNAHICSKAIIEGIPDNPLYQKYAMTGKAEEVVNVSIEENYPKPKEEKNDQIKEEKEEIPKEEPENIPEEEPKKEVRKLPITGR